MEQEHALLADGVSWIPAFSQLEASRCPDPLIERLVRALLPQAQADEVLRGFYTDILHTTLVKRLSELRDDTAVGPGGRRLTRLQNWRLRRVYEYVEHNLGSQLNLTDLAEAAGLSRMHFAAQFRVATGMNPHAYVTHRRIARAKTMLAETGTPIVEIALCVGFKSQPHFTTVFKHFVGYTPRHWRVLRADATLRQAA